MSLRLVSVTRRFGRQAALDDVSLHVRAGDCYGFLGHNGAGKTTAMRVLLGLLRPDSGQVLIDGFDALEHPLEARARLGGLIEIPRFHGTWNGPPATSLCWRVCKACLVERRASNAIASSNSSALRMSVASACGPIPKV